MSGQSFVHDRRGSMTAQRALRIFQACGGRCHICKRKLGPADDYEIEHTVALENGGTDDDANLAPACSWCHREKTSDDHALASHGRKMAAKAFVPKRFQQRRGWLR
tara:strand:- start:505 stop:822 length:318 start_codon:yes stop_codon:yes gene_type:complete